MKRQILLLILCLLPCALRAQTPEGPELPVYEAQVDSSLLGMDICSIMPACVTVNQSDAVRNALACFAERNSSLMYNGFRIRIYYDSVREARSASMSAMNKFSEMFPDIPVYRSYVSPNFKVTIGNFRSRTDAEVVLNAISADFPDATIIGERFKYPSIGRRNIAVDL